MKMASIPINQNLTVAAILPAQHNNKLPHLTQICQLQSIGSLAAADLSYTFSLRFLLDFL
jgi:hypothetical protein